MKQITLDELIEQLQQVKEVHKTAGSWPISADGKEIIQIVTISNSQVNISTNL